MVDCGRPQTINKVKKNYVYRDYLQNQKQIQIQKENKKLLNAILDKNGRDRQRRNEEFHLQVPNYIVKKNKIVAENYERQKLFTDNHVQNKISLRN